MIHAFDLTQKTLRKKKNSINEYQKIDRRWYRYWLQNKKAFWKTASTANLSRADGICFGLTVMLRLCQALHLNHHITESLDTDRF